MVMGKTSIFVVGAQQKTRKLVGSTVKDFFPSLGRDNINN